MKKLFHSRRIGTTLASAVVASMLVLGVAQAEERQGSGYGQDSEPGSSGQAPNGSGMDAHPGGQMMPHGEGSGDLGRSQGQAYGRGQGYVDGPGFGSGHQGYEEEMERPPEQDTEMKQERRESMEEGGDGDRQSGE